MLSKILCKNNRNDHILPILCVGIVMLIPLNYVNASPDDIYFQGTVHNATTYSTENEDTPLYNNVPQNHSITNNTQGAGWDYFYFDVASGASTLFADLTNLSADLDLYLRFGSKPTANNYDCRPYSGGTNSENCTVQSPTNGRWWIGVNNYDTGTINYTISTSWNFSEGPDIHAYILSSSDTSPIVSQPYTLEAPVQNIGDLDSGATTIRYYSSPDATINSSDFQFYSRSLQSLQPGHYIYDSLTVTTSSAGWYYVGVCVDPVNGETETDNNCSPGLLINVYESDQIFEDGFDFNSLLDVQTQELEYIGGSFNILIDENH